MYEVVEVAKNSWCMDTGRAEVLGVIGRYQTLREAATAAGAEDNDLGGVPVDYRIEVRSDDDDDPAYGENGVIDFYQYAD